MTEDYQLRLLYDLIKDGELYEDYIRFSGRISEYYQTYFLAWRYQVISQLRSIGSPFSDLVVQIENDNPLDYYNVTSFRNTLGALKGAYRVLESYKQCHIEPTSGNTYGILETQQTMNTCIESASDEKLGFSEDKVFIVHGHDSGLLQNVARYISSFDIEPIILQEQTGNGQTIIEKLEKNSDVNFAIVLLTPDDIGSIVSEKDLKPRARQNVILELGYFFGKLGRANVRALYDERVELPSDIIGIEYIKIDNSNGWKLKLAKEMKQCGLKIDMNKL